jgi:hypothetical protein
MRTRTCGIRSSMEAGHPITGNHGSRMSQSSSRSQSVPVQPMAAATVERPAPMFGWASVWRSLWLRKWQLAGVFVLTVGVYAAGLALPILTQRAVDMIASGTAARSWSGSPAEPSWQSAASLQCRASAKA